MTQSKLTWNWPDGKNPTVGFAAVIEAIEALLTATQEVLQEVVPVADSRYESSVAACAQILLCLTYAWAVPDLARLGLQTFAPACSSARGALEVAAKAAWLVEPTDPMSREGRWLGWYKSLERFYQNLAADFASIPSVASKMKKSSDLYGNYRTAITEKLPAAYQIVNPGTMQSILRELDLAALYPLYRSHPSTTMGSHLLLMLSGGFTQSVRTQMTSYLSSVPHRKPLRLASR
jgi:hypothetical protein